MPVFNDVNALITYINGQITTNGVGAITGVVHRTVLQTIVQSLLDITSNLPGSTVFAFPPWDAGATYAGGEEVVVRHNDKLWLFVSASDNIGTEPGTNALVWQQISALQLSHFRNKDQFLDEGGPYQVTAEEVWNAVHAAITASTWLNAVDDVVSAPTGAEVDGARYLVDSGTAEFEGHDGQVATKESGAWVFSATANGNALRVLAKRNAIYLRDDDQWKSFVLPLRECWRRPVNMRLNAPLGGTPLEGTRVAIGLTPVGAFAGHPGEIAEWKGGAWIFEACEDGDVTLWLNGFAGVTNPIIVTSDPSRHVALYRQGGTWVSGVPTIAAVLQSNSTDIGDGFVHRRRSDVWQYYETSANDVEPPWPNYSRMRISGSGALTLTLGNFGGVNGDFEIEVIRDPGTSISYANGPYGAMWASSGWMVTEVPPSGRAYMLVRVAAGVCTVINSNLNIGTGATADIDADDELPTNDAVHVPSTEAVRSYIAARIADLVDSSPGTLDTLNELAAALGDDPNFAATLTATLAGKQAASAVLTTLAGANAYGQALVTAATYDAMRGLLAAMPSTTTLDQIPVAAAVVKLGSQRIEQLADPTNAQDAATKIYVDTVAAGGTTDPELLAIAALASAAGKGIRFTGSGTAETIDITDAAKALLDDANAAAMRTTLGVVASTDIDSDSALPTNDATHVPSTSATRAYVAAAIAALVDSSPGTLDTLNELAAALGDDPNFAATLTTTLAGKQAASAVLTTLAGSSSDGQDLVTAANYAAMRSLLGLGTAALLNQQRVSVGAGQTTSSTSFANITGLSLSLEADTTYRVVLAIAASCSSTSGSANIGLNGSAAASWVAARLDAAQAAGNYAIPKINAYDFTGFTITSSEVVNEKYYYRIEGIIRNGGSASTLNGRIRLGGSGTVTIHSATLEAVPV